MTSFNIHLLPDHYISELFIRRVHALGIMEKNKFVVKSMNSNGMEMNISDLKEIFPHVFFVLEGQEDNLLRSICGTNDVLYLHRLDAISEKVASSMYGLVKA